MDLSFVRAFIASSRDHLDGLKRQAKRLQTTSESIFGQTYQLSVCQEAIARANGYKGWGEVAKLLARVGRDRKLPFWHLTSRNDAHLSVLAALNTLEIETRDSRAVAFLGERVDAALPALCLWAEEISYRKVPGLILVETSSPTINDTLLWGAVTELELDGTFKGFRFVDTRQRQIDLAISATARWWFFSVLSSMEEREREAFRKSGVANVFEAAIRNYAREGGRPAEHDDLIGIEYVQKAARLIANPSRYVQVMLDRLEGFEHDSFAIDTKKYLENVPRFLTESFAFLADDLEKRYARLGIVLDHEAKSRPTVVLFSRQDKVSHLLAAAIQGMYSCLSVQGRDCRPVLYYSESEPGWFPEILLQSPKRILVDGSTSSTGAQWDTYGTKDALLVQTGKGWASAAGRRCEYGE